MKDYFKKKDSIDYNIDIRDVDEFIDRFVLIEYGHDITNHAPFYILNFTIKKDEFMKLIKENNSFLYKSLTRKTFFEKVKILFNNCLTDSIFEIIKYWFKGAKK